MRKGAVTRATILQAAVETACVAGIGGLNLQPLADRVGMTKSGLYAHFGAKEALQVATLEHAATLFQQAVVAPAKAEAAGLPRLAGVFERWLQWPANAGLPGSCPFFAAAVELDDAKGRVRERLVRLSRDFQQVFEQLIASAVRHGHLGAGTDVALLAHELVGLRFAQHWAMRLMREPQATARSRAAFAALVARGAARAA